MQPGATALQRMLRDASSLATDLVKPMRPAFGSGVIGLAGIARFTDDGRNVDDRTTALFHHQPRYGLGAVEGPVEVGIEDGLLIFFFHDHEQPVAGDARIID